MSTRPNLEVVKPGDRLESWKEIASFLARSERTVRRWEENEGLPVHRLIHEKRGSVYAYRWELDEWRESRKQLLEAEPVLAVAATLDPPAALTRRWRAELVVAMLTVAAVAAGWAGYLLLHRTAPQTPAQTRPLNPEAVRAFRKGAEFSRDLGRKQVQSGIRYLEEAVRLDSSFARAWAALASAHIASSWFMESPGTETYAQATAAAQKALALDARSSAWKALGLTSHLLDWDHVAAERYLRKAIDLNPRDAGARDWFSVFLIEMGRLDEAAGAIQQARDLDPAWLESDTVYGDIYLFSGDPDQAMAQYRRIIETRPSYGLAHVLLGRAYLVKGEQDTAIAELRRGNELLGEAPFSMADLAYALARTGHETEASEILAGFMKKRQEGYYPAFAVGQVELGLGHTEAALDWLERAAGERLFGWYLPSADPFYKPIRSLPRFRNLMRRMNLRP